MEFNEILLNEFNNQKDKYYDEAIVESKIIKLENELFRKNCDIKKIYFELKSNMELLNKMIMLRLIDFIISKFDK